MSPLLTHRDGPLRPDRVLATLVLTGAVAAASIPLVVIVSRTESGRVWLGMLLVLGAKLPFLAVVFWLMLRALRLTPAGLTRAQAIDILDYLDSYGTRAHQSDAWWVADQLPDGPLKARAVETAVRLTRRR